MSETTQQEVKPVRARDKADAKKKETHFTDLQAEAKTLGINTFGLGKAALEASIKAVKGALSNATPETQVGESVVAPTETAEDELPRLDDDGEPLGPQNIKRIPLGTSIARLSNDQRPGYYRRWINDVPGRLERARRAGYEHVKDPKGEPVSTPAGTQEQGGGLRAYLMEMPNELRNEDLAAKSATVDEIDNAINRGKFKEQQGDNRYVPDSGISITRR